MTTNAGPISSPSAPASEPIVATSTGVSFEDLADHLEAPKGGAKKSSPPEEKGEKNASPKKQKADSKEEADEGETDGKSKGEEKSSGKDKNEVEGQKEKIKDSKPKVFKVKVGDQELDIPTTTELEVTVAGKPEKVTIEDLKSQYAGKVDYTRKYTELDKERKSFHSERDSIQGSINKLHDLAVKQNNPLEAVAFLTEAMGGSALEVMQQIRSSFWEQFEKLKDLSPEQRQALETQEELQFLKKRDSDRATAEKTQKLESEVGQRVKAIQEAHNLSDAGFYQAYQALKDSGLVDPNGITPELVGEYVKVQAQMASLGSIAKEVNPALELKPAEIEELYSLMRANKFQPDDMREIIAEVYGSKGKPSRLAKKLKGVGQRSSDAPPMNPRSEPISFDDL